MQGDLERRQYGTAAEATRALLKEGGVSRLFAGVGWRTFNITATVYIAHECCERLPPYITALTRGL